MKRKYFLVGEKFGRLLVLKESEIRDKNNLIMWDCICDCGKTHSANTYNLKYGGVKSCGCYRIDVRKEGAMSPEELKEKKAQWSVTWRENHPEKHRANCQKWRTENHEKDLANKAKYREINKDKLKISYRGHILKKKFGISREEYDSMLLRQNGVCEICKLPCKTGKSLAVDHNHETGKIRSLLCRDCNITLGLMKEDVNRLRAAALYLETHNKRLIIL